MSHKYNKFFLVKYSRSATQSEEREREREIVLQGNC